MPSDRTRTSDHLSQRYKAVVMQQGRVILDRDFNALQEIVDRRIAADALDGIGPCGTPDDGFAISLPEIGPSASVAWSHSAPNPWDFLIAPGTMYVGGQRVVLPPPPPGQPRWSYFNQPEWIHSDAPDAFSGSYSTLPHEYVYLHVFEQEVSAVEDPDLLDVALGGPDTTQRVRLMWRVVRMPVDATDCMSALARAEVAWSAQGFRFDASTMELLPQAALQVSFSSTPAASNPCDPVAEGGYLGAENQLIRLQIGESLTGPAQLLWGYDDASFLYSIAIVGPDGQTLQLRQAPVDAFHYPKPRQVVEVLRAAAILGTERDATDPTGQRSLVRCVAEATGRIATVKTYSNVENTVTLDSPLPKDYGSDPNPLFLRIWQGQESINLSSSQPIPLTDPTGQTSPGILVTITVPPGGPKGAAPPVGTFWMIAARPSTPQAVYPERFLTGPQPPDGPRQWVCPLAVINWASGGSVSAPAHSGPDAIIGDCRQHFDNLVNLTNRPRAGELTVMGVFYRAGYGQEMVLQNGDTIRVGDLAQGLRVFFNQVLDPATVGRAACSVTLELPFSFRGYDLRLMSPVNDVSGIPTEGKSLIIVVAVDNVLHFRIFDGDGKMVVDTDEERLTDQAQQINNLRKQLQSLWPPHGLTSSEKDLVVTAVTSIVGHIPFLDACVGHQPVVLDARVGVGGPAILTWSPNKGAIQFVTDSLQHALPEHLFAEDWDAILPPDTKATWDYDKDRYVVVNVDSTKHEWIDWVYAQVGEVPWNLYPDVIAVSTRVPLRAEVVSMALTATAPKVDPVVGGQYHAGKSVGLAFNVISGGHDYWVLQLNFWRPSLFDEICCSLNVVHFVNNAPTIPLPATYLGIMTEWEYGLPQEVTLNLIPKFGNLFYYATVTFEKTDLQGNHKVVQSPMSGFPGSLTGGFGPAVQGVGQVSFSQLVIHYPATYDTVIPYVSSYLCYLTVKRDFLGPSLDSGRRAPPGDSTRPIAPDYSLWFWLSPGGGEYGYYSAGYPQLPGPGANLL